MTEHTVRVTVLNESLYGESYTLADWQGWLKKQFDMAPPEYRDSAVLEIESVGGYEGEHHTEATLYYYRPETEAERDSRHSREQASADEEERIAERRLAHAKARRERLAQERQ